MRNRLLILFLLCNLFAQSQLLKQSSFENPMPTNYNGCCNASYAPWSCIEGVSNTYSHQISTLYKRSGNSSWRTENRPGDAAVCYGSKRAEMTMIPKGSAIATGANSFAISVLIPASGSTWVNLTQESIVGMQSHPWQGSTTNGSPNWAIQIKSGRWRLAVVHTGANTANNAPQTFLYYDMGPVSYDVWTDWEVYCNNLKTTSGRIIVNKITNGVRQDKIVNYTGYALHGFSDWPFIKEGTYCWGLPATGPARIVYYDMARYGIGTEANFSSIVGLPGTTPPPNIPPTCNAGANQSLGSTTVATVTGSEADSDGTIASRLWQFVSGPNTPSITSPTSLSTTITGLIAGSYVFRLTVTDNLGATATSTTGVTIAAINTPPVANAGPAQNLPAGTTSFTLDGEATDAQEGDCCSIHTWSQVSGPNTTTFTPGAWNPVVTGAIAGTYVFKLRVQDSGGLSSEATVSITIAQANIPPTVNPAPPYILLNSVTESDIAVTAIGNNATIVSYSWAQSSGPNTSTIVNGTLATAHVTGLIVGIYIYTCSVTDNHGLVGYAAVTVEVNKPPVVDLSGNTDSMFVKNTASIPIVGSATDPDGSIVSYKWTVTQGTGTFANDAAANTTFTPTAGNVTYSLQLEATDNHDGKGASQYAFQIVPGFMLLRKGLILPIH